MLQNHNLIQLNTMYMLFMDQYKGMRISALKQVNVGIMYFINTLYK